MRLNLEIENMKQLDDFAKAFSSIVKKGMIVLFNGDLGSGKTTFIKALVKALGSRDEVTSPTYTLLNIYDADFPIYHFDMYRIASAEEARDAGFEEYFDKAHLDGLVLVEWAENVVGLIGQADFVVRITKLGETRRKFEILEGNNAGN